MQIQGHCDDLDGTVAGIQQDPKRQASQNRDLEVPTVKAQHDLTKTAIQIDLQDSVAQQQVGMEENTERKQRGEEDEQEEGEQVQSETWIQRQSERRVTHILYDLNVPADGFEQSLDKMSIRIQKDREEIASLTQSEMELNPTTPRSDDGMSLDNFVLHKVLGRGYFGKVGSDDLLLVLSLLER